MHLLIFGLGYCGAAVAAAARAAGFTVTGTLRRADVARPDLYQADTRRPAACHADACRADARQPAASGAIGFDAAAEAIATATHLLSSVPPDEHGDPVLARYGAAIGAAAQLRWLGYLSSTVVYGDRGGDWVDEDTPPAPSQSRGWRRLAAETAWSAYGDRCAVDIFRLAGIYGPGRSAFDELRSGRARRIVKPGHAFGRIHRADIVGAVLAAMRQTPPPGRRIFNLNDDEPAATAAVIEAAADLLGMPPPPAMAYADAEAGMSAMARSFWSENRRVASRKTRATLHYNWRYPSYREGLRAILREESGQLPA